MSAPRLLQWFGGALAVALLSACVGSKSATPSASTPPPVLNSVTLTVDAGPTAGSSAINHGYVTVKVCQHGSSDCANIDHVLVDTASWGLRLVGSVLAANSVTLTEETDSSARTIEQCVTFTGGQTWGPVAVADVSMAGELASNVPVQIMDDTAASAPPPASCGANGTLINSVSGFNANGVLGIGVFAQDCGAACVSAATPLPIYYGCTSRSRGRLHGRERGARCPGDQSGLPVRRRQQWRHRQPAEPAERQRRWVGAGIAAVRAQYAGRQCVAGIRTDGARHERQRGFQRHVQWRHDLVARMDRFRLGRLRFRRPIDCELSGSGICRLLLSRPPRRCRCLPSIPASEPTTRAAACSSRSPTHARSCPAPSRSSISAAAAGPRPSSGACLTSTADRSTSVSRGAPRPVTPGPISPTDGRASGPARQLLGDRGEPATTGDIRCRDTDGIAQRPIGSGHEQRVADGAVAAATGGNQGGVTGAVLNVECG